ncbi:hypothetical protein BU16DRAFT_463098 [Lophium mytilinum]|uniref:Fumarylacetoacetase-like C-terminal domain-containing protein n=1 Tax=Lophium mytilinum TaxID=390894 RepID=A0A6A6QV76_9PEZI|nr:hypothetical protein BU16DRAFT_463098 [Lophium mytilinum]
MKTAFGRLVRFKSKGGEVLYGEAPTGDDLVGKTVELYEGEQPWELKATGKKAEIAEVLSPLPAAPIFYGIGLNYKAHIAEAGFPTPGFPTVFTKPADALAGPFEDITIYKDCQKTMDYEGELTVIIGKPALNLTESDDPFDYILGYTTGNDVSCRYWQMPEQSGNQHGYAKSFDQFGPIGPVLVSPSLIQDPAALTLKTFVNGEERQSTSTSDLLFNIPQIIRHLSRGTTLRPGTAIMTGTPSGVAAFMKPPAWLQDGDVVEVKISEIGSIKNKYVFEK